MMRLTFTTAARTSMRLQRSDGRVSQILDSRSDFTKDPPCLWTCYICRHESNVLMLLRLSSTDCTLGNIPKTGGFCAAKCVPVRAQMGLSCRLQYKIWTEKLQRDEIPTAKLVVAFNEGPIWTV
ncbi:hypothetical protein AVEN_85491-1 [Araneus ventricosus]|uniref:Uncharacterized protein n=1 Tax=Araneus ventricosus TaxID=182803 RepID=A0A4Y2I000_ARAVE|nr:hypothetical protein AVEN_85491-1 [Araneus ventricosus]